jgi:hypothetical protein
VCLAMRLDKSLVDDQERLVWVQRQLPTMLEANPDTRLSVETSNAMQTEFSLLANSTTFLTKNRQLLSVSFTLSS